MLRAHGNDIAVFFARVSGLDTHEYQIRFTLVRLLGQILQRLKVIVLDIGIDRAYHNRFLRINLKHIHKIGGSQSDRRKSISSAGLHGNADIVAQLIVDRGNLRLAGCDRHGSIRVNLLDLTIYSLHHGLIGAVLLLEYLDKLFASDIIGQRPQALSGATG